MSTNIQTLNKNISLNDNTDELLEQKIKENEKIFENLDISKNENSQLKENNELESNEFNKIIVNENINEKNENENISNEIKNIDINNKIEDKNEINIKDYEKLKPKENKKNKDIIELIKSKTDNSITGANKDKSNITNKINEKNKISKNKKNAKNPKSMNEKKKNNLKKINNNNHNQPKKQTQNSNKYETQINNPRNHNRKIIKDNVDLNLYTQYTSLYSSNKKRINNSLRKRNINNTKNEKNISKSQDKSLDKSQDKSRDKSAEKFKITYDKFLENEKKRKENLEKMKRKKEEEMKRIYVYKPRINEKSKEIIAKKKENKEDFYTRQKKLMEQYKRNEDNLREKIRKEKDNTIKNSVFSQKYLTNKDKYKNVKSRLFDWEEKQKSIINNSSKKNTIEKEDTDSENNKTTYVIKVNRNINKVINRLYKNDLEKRKYNLEILNEIYTPSFQPTLFENKNITNRMKSLKIDDKMKNKNRSTINIKPNIDLDNDMEEEEEKVVEKIDNITSLLRNRLFSKVKKKEGYRSAIKFDVINDENIYEIKNENNNYRDNQQEFYKHPKASSSFVKQSKKYKI